MMANPAFSGWPVVKYDGTNAEDIVKALKLEEGDVIVSGERPFLVKAMAWEDLRFSLVVEGER